MQFSNELTFERRLQYLHYIIVYSYFRATVSYKSKLVD